LKKTEILIIVQRSNGDVYLSKPIIDYLIKEFNAEIDILVNDDTISVAKLFTNIRSIILFSYERKKSNRFTQELNIIKRIYRKYDYSINLTSSDRSVVYCLLSGKRKISAVESSLKKSWWKKIFLTGYYEYNNYEHILLQNLKSLEFLNVPFKTVINAPNPSSITKQKINILLEKLNITSFVIFHPCAQYDYKVYPEFNRNKLLDLLNNLNIPILVTGGSSKNDKEIGLSIPKLKNVFNLIGKTSLAEFVDLSRRALCYIGMDTLNMHIAASQNKRVFAIFGPTNTSVWSPWSNTLKKPDIGSIYTRNYGQNTIFQANLPCVPCGKAGCNDQHTRSECLFQIEPERIYKEVSAFLE